MSKPEILSLTPPSDHLASLLSSYARTTHSVLTSLLSHLNHHLGLPPSTLESLHSIHRSSPDVLRFVHSTPSASQPYAPAKTHPGTLTFLLTHPLSGRNSSGLQVLPPECDSWHDVVPLPNHAIIQLGDALSAFSNRLLRSNIHREADTTSSTLQVDGSSEANGEPQAISRYDLHYHLCPADGVVLRKLESEVIPPGGCEESGWVRSPRAIRFERRDEGWCWSSGGNGMVRV